MCIIRFTKPGPSGELPSCYFLEFANICQHFSDSTALIYPQHVFFYDVCYHQNGKKKQLSAKSSKIIVILNRKIFVVSKQIHSFTYKELLTRLNSSEVAIWVVTLPKFDMEPKNDAFQKESPYSRVPFSGSMLNFGRVTTESSFSSHPGWVPQQSDPSLQTPPELRW